MRDVTRGPFVMALVLVVGCDDSLQARERGDGGDTIDAASIRDAAIDAASGRDAPTSIDGGGDAPSAPDTGPLDCTHSASGTTPIWTCTSDHTARQRCTAGFTETQSCTFGACIGMPSGVDDVCPSDPTLSNASMYCPGGQCVHWWNCNITYQYQYTGSGDWDTDFHMPDGTPIALPHRSQLTAVYYAGAGFQPEFADLVTSEWVHYNHLHLNSEFGGDDHALGPVQLVSLTDPDHPDHIYPEGWVVGFSGGGTQRTGYMGTDSAGNVCSGGHSTASHFCAVTHVTHSIDYYLPHDGTGCTSPLGWPSAVWSAISPLAPGYQNCPNVCTGCGVAHF